ARARTRPLHDALPICHSAPAPGASAAGADSLESAAESLDVVLHGAPVHFGTKVVSCMMGMRMEKTMKATPPPIATIMTGSSRLRSEEHTSELQSLRHL